MDGVDNVNSVDCSSVITVSGTPSSSSSSVKIGIEGILSSEMMKPMYLSIVNKGNDADLKTKVMM